MRISYFEAILLYCLNQISGERSIYSIYHLLNGKKSSQTIQDAHIFQLFHFFRVFPSLNREEFNRVITSLEKCQLIQLTDQYGIITSLGKEHLKDVLIINPIPKYLNGWKFHHLVEIFWKRFTLFVQVVSNFKHQESQYMPIQRDKEIQRWLKRFLKDNKNDRQALAEQLRKELMVLLENKDLAPETFVIRLTGYQTFGLTAKQAAEALQMDETHYQIQFLNVLHYLIEKTQSGECEIPLLRALLADQKNEVTLTNSTQKTLEFIQRGYSIPQIAKMRNLKPNTIEDHLVEITFNMKEFNIENYVDLQMQQKILLAAKQANSKQLKAIRPFVEEASYFEMRLVLAKHGVGS